MIIFAHVEANNVFGLASIRSDKTPPRMRQLGDTMVGGPWVLAAFRAVAEVVPGAVQNYGDEKGSKSLVHPKSYNFDGVFDEDLEQGRSRAEVRPLPLLECRPLGCFVGFGCCFIFVSQPFCVDACIGASGV